MTDVQDDQHQAAPATKRRRRGWTFWTGLGLVLAGLSILGWIGWQFYGTNYVSQKRQQETVQQLEQEWAKPGGGAESVQTRQGKAFTILRIPAIDLTVPVLEGIEDDALASGIGHFETSADPGDDGNYALAGHRVTHGEPLRDMPDLQAGDEVILETRDWVYTYVLDTGGEGLRVPFTAGWVVDPVPVNPDPGGVGPLADKKKLITLTTCAELFHTDDRLVAFGHLQSAVPR